MSNGVTIPVGMNLLEWSAQIRNDLPHYNIPVLENINKWRDWACFIKMTNNSIDLPNPDENSYPGTEGFKQWAIELVELNDK
jgi:hypothetical protein